MKIVKLKALNEVCEWKDYFCCRPIPTALTLLSQGANGNTFEQLRSSLGLPTDKTLAADQFQKYRGLLQQSVGKSVLSVADRVYVMKGYTMNPSFRSVAAEKFSSGFEELNFVDSEASTKIVNQFVEEQTNQKIKDLIKKGDFTALTRMVLVNAIYFKGNWQYQFDKKLTKKGDFFTSEAKTSSVEFMHIKAKFNYAKLHDLDATVLEMNYADSDLTFMIILPNNRTGLSELETKLKSYDMSSIDAEMYTQEVDVTIPKFKAESDLKLNDNLKNIGMTDMFGKACDLSGLGGGDLVVTKVAHKAFIEINEEGAEAAAATAVIVGLRGGPPPVPRFRADHPFVYFIRDVETNTNIFSGRMQKFE